MAEIKEYLKFCLSCHTDTEHLMEIKKDKDTLRATHTCNFCTRVTDESIPVKDIDPINPAAVGMW